MQEIIQTTPFLHTQVIKIWQCASRTRRGRLLFWRSSPCWPTASISLHPSCSGSSSSPWSVYNIKYGSLRILTWIAIPQWSRSMLHLRPMDGAKCKQMCINHQSFASVGSWFTHRATIDTIWVVADRVRTDYARHWSDKWYGYLHVKRAKITHACVNLTALTLHL